MATSEGIPSSIDIEFLELNDNPYLSRETIQETVYSEMNALIIKQFIRNNLMDHRLPKENLTVFH